MIEQCSGFRQNMWLLTEQQKRAKIIVPFHKLMQIEMQFLICNKTTLEEISVPLPPQDHTIVHFSRCFVFAPCLSFLRGCLVQLPTGCSFSRSQKANQRGLDRPTASPKASFCPVQFSQQGGGCFHRL